MTSNFSTKTIRGSQFLSFLHYLYGIKFLTKDLEIWNESYDYNEFFEYFERGGNVDANGEGFMSARIALIEDEVLNLHKNSNDYEIVSSVHLVFEQIDTLVFVSNHVLEIILRTIKKKRYFKKFNEANVAYSKTYIEYSQYAPLFNVYWKEQRYEDIKREEERLKKDYFTGSNVLGITEEIGKFIELLSHQNENNFRSNSRNYKALESFKLNMYAVILVDFIELFQVPFEIQRKCLSDKVLNYLEDFNPIFDQENDLHKFMKTNEIFEGKRGEFTRNYDSMKVLEMWCATIKKYAPLPGTINHIEGILSQ